jgi:hypothetical protein
MRNAFRIVAVQVPAERLCPRCAEKRWGEEIYNVDFDAPEYPQETTILYSWDLEERDSCTECFEELG